VTNNTVEIMVINRMVDSESGKVVADSMVPDPPFPAGETRGRAAAVVDWRPIRILTGGLVTAESPALAVPAPRELTNVGRWVILAAAFFGWLFAGAQMTTMSLAARSATTEFLRRGCFGVPSEAEGQSVVLTWEHDAYVSIGPIPIPIRWPFSAPDIEVSQRDLNPFPNEAEHLKTLVPRWAARYNSLFLFGAAFGGLVFGWIGDRWGRVRAMSLSILCYSLFTGIAFVAPTPEILLALRFLTGMGIGGMWPTGISLASEAWSDVSRPALAGFLGTSANVGIVLMGALAFWVWPVTPTGWRWMMWVGATPALLGVLVWMLVPESPRWLATRDAALVKNANTSDHAVFRPPLLWRTLLGITLGTIPLLGGWGATQWMVLWTDAVAPISNPHEKALTVIMRAGGGTIGSLIGGWIADQLGRRTTYFIVSLVSWGLCEFIYLTLNPAHDASFNNWVFAAGFVTTIYFGWLPLYLPELFPTAARATGTGVSFNFGRIATAFGVLGTGWLVAHFHEDYARAGSILSLIYAAGLVVILFAPDTTKQSALSGQPSG
jgi:MFS family permease